MKDTEIEKDYTYEQKLLLAIKECSFILLGGHHDPKQFYKNLAKWMLDGSDNRSLEVCFATLLGFFIGIGWDWMEVSDEDRTEILLRNAEG